MHRQRDSRDDRNGQISELSSFDSINTVIQRTDNQMASSQDIETQDENNAVTEETNNDNKLEAGECGNTCSIDFDFYFLKLRESCAWFILNVSTGNIRLVTKHRIWGIHNYSSTHLNFMRVLHSKHGYMRSTSIFYGKLSLFYVILLVLVD